MAITPPGAGTFTIFHLAVLGVLILATLALIVVGVRRSLARRAAQRRVEVEAKEAGVPEPPVPTSPVARDDAPLLDRVDAAPPADGDFVHPRPVASESRKAELDPAPLAGDRIAAAALGGASPATLADPTSADAPATPSTAEGPVTQLKGLGPKVATRLAELGLSSVGQIAALDADQAAAVDARLGPFAGRLQRDRWVEQARFLAAGDTKGFEAVFGRL